MAELNQKIKKLNFRLSAFTMLESVVAITIISVLIGLGSATYSNILTAESPFVFHKAKLEAQRCFDELSESKLYTNKSFAFEDFSIEQNVKFLKRDEKLYYITFAAYDISEKMLFTEEHLIAK